MNTEHETHTVLPYPRTRLLMVDGGRLGRQRHTVHGLVEFDITMAREAIRQHKVQTGETLSFSAFFLACLGKAIDQDKRVHAYRNWRNQLIIFDEVDVNMLFEVEVDGKKTIRPHILRGVNKKSLRELHEEIRAFQMSTKAARKPGSSNGLCGCPALPGACSCGRFSRTHSGSKRITAPCW